MRRRYLWAGLLQSKRMQENKYEHKQGVRCKDGSLYFKSEQEEWEVAREKAD